MKPLSTRFIAAAALALGAFGAASAAHAGSGNVHFSVGVHAAPGVYVQPAPVYVQPRPVYVAPRPIYVAPAPVYVRPDQYGRSRHCNGLGGRSWQRRGPYGDLDRDGIVNRHDRDRDGDGVRNRNDRFPQDPYRY